MTGIDQIPRNADWLRRPEDFYQSIDEVDQILPPETQPAVLLTSYAALARNPRCPDSLKADLEDRISALSGPDDVESTQPPEQQEQQ